MKTVVWWGMEACASPTRDGGRGRRSPIEWPLLAMTPDGMVGDWWMAKAIDTGSAPPVSGLLEEPVVEHVAGAVVTLLAGLEHERHPAPQLAPPGNEELGRAGEHGHMGVVAAGVHGAVDLAGVVEAGVLGHGEGIHVAPQQHGGPGLGAVEHRHHRGGRGAGGDDQRQPVQGLQHGGLCVGQVETELRLLVQPPPQLDGALQLAARLVEHPVEHVNGHGRRP